MLDARNDGGGEDQMKGETLNPPVDSAAVAQLCLDLAALQAERTFCIKNQSRADRSIEAFIARKLGYHAGLEEADRKKRFKESRAIRVMVEKGGGEDHFALGTQSGIVLSAVSPLILLSAQSRQAWDNHRANVEKAMRKIARQLPVWSWVESVRGLSDLGLAVIIGEAGSLGEYGNPAKLWKRMGLAVIDGKRQGNPGTGATADDWIRHGYVARRRAEVWAFVDDVMLRAQWRAERDGVPAHAIGPYGEVYAAKRAEYVAREHPAADRAARRYMAKRLLRDLWAAWRAASPVEQPSASLPPSDLSSSGIAAGETTAIKKMNPGRGLPPPQSLEPARKRGRRAARYPAQPKGQVPSSDTFASDGDGLDQLGSETHLPRVEPDNYSPAAE